MKTTPATLSATAIGLCMAMAVPAAAATTGYSLGNNGTTLVTMSDLSTPSNLSGVAISDGVRLNSLAYRPNTDQLYGFSQQTGTVYTVDRNSGQVGAVTSIDAADPGVNVGEVGFDFNNFLDAARIVSTEDDNLVFFPNNAPPNVGRVTSLAYNAGDANEGSDPSVFANGYTNQVPNAASTTQYVFDSELDILAILNNNEGTLDTIGRISVDGVSPLDFTATGGFDIFSPEFGANTGYALLSTALGEGLYQIDSFEVGASGYVEAMFLGEVGGQFGNLDGLAVFDVAPVPLPAGALLMGSALLGFGAVRRLKRGA